jgi:hypothetical protein
VRAATSKPLNVLFLPGGLTRDEIFAAGAQRISTGGALCWVAVEAFANAARSIGAGDMSVLSARPNLKEWLA